MVEFVDISASSKRLAEVGIPEAHAERIVEVMTDTLTKVTDRLVTRDHLDLRIQEQHAYMDKRFSELESRMIKTKAETDVSMMGLGNKLNILSLMVGLGFTVLIIPMLKGLFSG